MAIAKKEKKSIPAVGVFDSPTPKEIVQELDRYIIGQADAKKMVAIALRNRARRKLLPENLRDEVAPKNIIMIGPTGVGKTEIARRLSNLANAPFVKVEASKFTEVGYVGRDVESIIRDLIGIGVSQLKKEMMKEVQDKAAKIVEEKILDLLFPIPVAKAHKPAHNAMDNVNIAVSGSEIRSSVLPEAVESTQETSEQAETFKNTRDKIRERFMAGEYENKYVELEVKEAMQPLVEVFSNAGMDFNDMNNISGFMSGIMPKKTKKRKMTVAEARKHLMNEESEKLIDMEKVVTEAISRTENAGIVFIDEIDKIVGKDGGSGPDISRAGVQRDLLPIVEGSSVMTKFGVVNTSHILFIAAGAFHVAKPSDLIPELQGRFPIRVELKSLTADDFQNILTKPKNALIKQYVALLETEGVKLNFDESGIIRIAEVANKVNMETEDIGARRLHTIMEKIVEEISFNAPEWKGQEIKIDKTYVDDKLKAIVADNDLSRYIL